MYTGIKEQGCRMAGGTLEPDLRKIENSHRDQWAFWLDFVWESPRGHICSCYGHITG
jgi:hypothetical protein